MKKKSKKITQICICPECSDLFTAKIKVDQNTSIKFEPQICTKCLQGLVVKMDQVPPRMYA